MPTQDFGLSILNQTSLANFDIICSDGVRLPCGRGVLEERWPWFKAELAAHTKRVNEAIVQGYKDIDLQAGIKLDPLEQSDDVTVNNHSRRLSDASAGTETKASSSDETGKPPFRITPSTLHLPENSTVGLAILQYFHTSNLITQLQHTQPVLVSLLLFSRNYDLMHLRALVVHALHVRLGNGSASPAVVYEAAALSGCIALQTRALKMMMNANARTKAKQTTAADAMRRP